MFAQITSWLSPSLMAMPLRVTLVLEASLPLTLMLLYPRAKPPSVVETTEGSIFSIIGREYVEGTLSTTPFPKVVFATGVFTPALDVDTIILSIRL